MVTKLLLDILEISWHDNCKRALDNKLFASTQNNVSPSDVLLFDDIRRITSNINGPEDIMINLEYEIPTKINIYSRKEANQANTISIDELINNRKYSYTQSQWKVLYNQMISTFQEATSNQKLHDELQ